MALNLQAKKPLKSPSEIFSDNLKTKVHNKVFVFTYIFDVPNFCPVLDGYLTFPLKEIKSISHLTTTNKYVKFKS